MYLFYVTVDEWFISALLFPKKNQCSLKSIKSVQ